MIRRYLAVAVLAGAVALAPMTAFAASYPAPGSALTCSQTTVTESTVFTCTIQGPTGDNATLTATTSGANASIAGAVSLTKIIGVSNSAVFSVTAPASALTIGFTGTVGAAATNPAAVIVTARSGSLASTGAANMDIAIGAAALLILGGAALVIGARRRNKANA